MAISAVRRSFVAVGRSQAVRMMPAASSVSVRSFSKNAEGLSNEEITQFFTELDASPAAKSATAPPIPLTGKTGNAVASLLSSSKDFKATVAELNKFVDTIQKAGLIVDRFFSTSSYSPAECNKVLDILFGKKPFGSFESISDETVQSIIVDNAGNIPAWNDAIAAVDALKLTPTVVNTLRSLADAGDLARIKKIAKKASEVYDVTSKAVSINVTSAVPLSKAQETAVANALKKYSPAGTTPNVTYVVDNTIVGGLLVTIGNEIIDLSVSTDLAASAASLN